MSKKFLRLFALVAIFTLALSGSAFAANVTLDKTFTWRGVGGNGSGNFDSPANWDQNDIPTDNDLVVFPATTKNVSINVSTAVGAMRVDNGANAVFEVANGVTFGILGNLETAVIPVAEIEGIEIYGDVLFQGLGKVSFNNQLLAPTAFTIRTRENARLEFNLRVESAAAVTEILKKDKGVVAFTSSQMNQFAGATVEFTIQDGEVQIARADHMNNDADPSLNTLKVVYNTENIPERSATLTSTWSKSDTFNTTGKLTATTNGILNVSVEDSTFTARVAGTIDVAAGRTITKQGPGTLALNTTGVWNTNAATISTLNIAQGFVTIDADNALSAGAAVVPFEGVTNVVIGEGTRLTLNKDRHQVVRSTTGLGTLRLLETSQYDIDANCTFPGMITGAGSVGIGTLNGQIDRTVYISGKENNYTGDTQVYVGSKLQIDHEKNLGGTKLGKVYLQAADALATATTALTPTFARLELVDDRSFILPNELYLGIGAVAGSGGDIGGAVVIVPINTRLEIANNITFNKNTLVKAGEGEVVFSSIGYDSQGDGSFYTRENGAANDPVTVALQIINGKARIENERALALGEIVVDRGGFVATRPILSICNGLKMTNNIQFTDQSTFQTELIDANLSEGTAVASAVEVGKVFYNRTYVVNPTSNATDKSGVVYNRVAFNDLSAGTVTKGQDFQLMKATSYTNYYSPNVEPYEWDGQVKAPFDPYFSLTYLYFKATHNIDVPALGEPSITKVKPGASYSITIPVNSSTALKAGSATLFNLPGATIAVSGSNLVISGTVPAGATEGTIYNYRASVHTNGDVATSTLGYEGYADLMLLVTENTDPGPTPGEPTLTASFSVSDAAPERENEVTFTLGVWTYKNASGATSTVTAALGTPVLSGPADLVSDNLATNGTYVVKIKADAENGDVVKLSLPATYVDAGSTVSGTATGSATVYVDTPTPRGGGSSGGCDAGFAGLALLLAAPLFLRKKD